MVFLFVEWHDRCIDNLEKIEPPDVIDNSRPQPASRNIPDCPICGKHFKAKKVKYSTQKKKKSWIYLQCLDVDAKPELYNFTLPENLLKVNLTLRYCQPIYVYISVPALVLPWKRRQRRRLSHSHWSFALVPLKCSSQIFS